MRDDADVGADDAKVLRVAPSVSRKCQESRWKMETYTLTVITEHTKVTNHL